MVMDSQQGQVIKLFGATITLHGRHVKEEHNQADNPTLHKRPDKIIPCPRCNSIETKFCYFNNYNVNQPRHFCKGCERHWTAGGALQNVPVGAGRRKAKPLLPARGLARFSDGCLYDWSSGVHQFELEGMVLDDWHLTATNDGFRPVFPMKRRRISCSDDGTNEESINSGIVDKGINPLTSHELVATTFRGQRPDFVGVNGFREETCSAWGETGLVTYQVPGSSYRG